MESLAALLPVGPQDELTHRGARRRATRWPVHASVKVRSTGREASGVVLNASAGGMRVAVDRPCALGARVDVELSFVGDKIGYERAEVVWTRELPDGCLVGLRFV